MGEKFEIANLKSETFLETCLNDIRISQTRSKHANGESNGDHQTLVAE